MEGIHLTKNIIVKMAPMTPHNFFLLLNDWGHELLVTAEKKGIRFFLISVILMCDSVFTVQKALLHIYVNFHIVLFLNTPFHHARASHKIILQ